MELYTSLIWLAKLVGPATHPVHTGRYEILLTGTYYADNWILAHLGPLAMSKRCARIRMVSVSPVPSAHKVEGIYPPALLVRALGAVPARLLTFVWFGLRTRPHILGGFHLLVNGLVVALLSRLIGARSLYFCVGS